MFCISLSVNLFAQEEDPPEVQLGERLFMEERFSQFFYQHSNGNLNHKLKSGDPILEKIQTDLGLFDHPMKGGQISCASCHFVDQLSSISRFAALTYNDFHRRSPVPDRQDGLTRTTRHTSNMVGVVIKDQPLHWDGEFFSGTELACASLTGRNMGWQLFESGEARKHIVQILKKDDGSFAESGKSYQEEFSSLGVNITTLKDDELLEKACGFISDYMESLEFVKDSRGHIGSAYDQFLEVNGLPRKPNFGQTAREYADALRQEIMKLKKWRWVRPSTMRIHNHTSKFEELELEGAKIFFGRGQCAQCHTPPDFSDFGFHVTGMAQFDYDATHGAGSFANFYVPSHRERMSDPSLYLIPTEKNPHRLGVMRSEPRSDDPRRADLGVWNNFLHPEKESLREPLRQKICESLNIDLCFYDDEFLLAKSAGMFKTPGLRSLGQSAPYFSNGMGSDLRQSIQIYVAVSHMARHGKLVNGDEILHEMTLSSEDALPLKAFLEALDEDYE